MTTRIPNLLHTLLFLVLTVFALLLCEGVLAAAARPTPILITLADQKLQIVANAATYIVALGAAWFVFPLLWDRSFLTGLRWNSTSAPLWLAPAGLVLGFLSQAASSLLPIPHKLPIDKLLDTPGILWVLAGFGTIVAPLFEEVFFRGFLLPALTIAIDWARLPRSLESLAAWRSHDSFSRPALIASSFITSLCFALIHAPQLGYTWAAVCLLIVVSLVLCFVRIRFNSVAASTLVHCCYNLSVFITIFYATSGFRHIDKLNN